MEWNPCIYAPSVIRKTTPLLVLGMLFLIGAVSPATQRSKKQQGADANHFKKWLKEDVVYIITPEEKEIYSKLSTDEEREQFIEQFWQRRNPDTSSPENAFKEEHYRRIQYANDMFQSGEEGWKTDRGRIYIMYGPPTEVTRYSGGQYERSYNEGGGVTTTWPFEKWRYRHIEGIGDNVELEFVDDTLAGEYHLAMYPWEKDALLNVPNAGLTFAEQIGLSSKTDRMRNLYAANPQPGALASPGFRDSIFERMHQFFSLQRPPEIQFKDLKEKVTASIQYNMLPFRLRADWIYLGEGEVMVPITLKIENKDLTYQEMMGIQRATVNVYGSVKSLQGKSAAEFEDTLTTDYTPRTFSYRSFQNSVYQKRLVLKPGLYRLDMVVKDVVSGNIGTLPTRLLIPQIKHESLWLSPIILSKKVLELERAGDTPGQFEIGDLKIIPEVGNTFTANDSLHFYVQVYNTKMDQATGNPALTITYSFRASDGTIALSKTDDKGELLHYRSPQRLVCLGSVPLKSLPPGSYRIELLVNDRLANRRIETNAQFTVAVGHSGPNSVSGLNGRNLHSGIGGVLSGSP